MFTELVHTSAPGKLVLAGEYAVLAGAPAVVAAIDRRVTSRITGLDQDGWHFYSRGFEARSEHQRDALPTTPGDPATLARHAAEQLGIDPSALPDQLRFDIDSRPCYLGTAKLGLGSSAAATVSLGAALAAMAGVECTLARMLAIHAALQGGTGSGLDVAASFQGGVIRYRAGEVEPTQLPSDLRHAFVYVGWSTETRELVQRFNDWRRHGDPPELRRLVACAEAVAAPGGAFLEPLAAYIDALDALDRAARIGILSEPHRAAAALARRHGLLYKPCGAGGGDMGVALSSDGGALEAFCTAVAEAGLHVVPASIDPEGVQVRREDGAEVRCLSRTNP